MATCVVTAGPLCVQVDDDDIATALTVTLVPQPARGEARVYSASVQRQAGGNARRLYLLPEAAFFDAHPDACSKIRLVSSVDLARG